MENRGNTGFMAGVPELLILRLLQDREMYGYEIVQAIARRDRATSSPPAKGWSIPCCMPWRKTAPSRPGRGPPAGRTRIYYTLTSKGVRRLFDLTDDWTRLNRAVGRCCGGAPMRFEALRETLLQGGIAPRHVRRYLRELDDHLADLTAGAACGGS